MQLLPTYLQHFPVVPCGVGWPPLLRRPPASAFFCISLWLDLLHGTILLWSKLQRMLHVSTFRGWDIKDFLSKRSFLCEKTPLSKITSNFTAEEFRDSFAVYTCYKQKYFKTRHSIRTLNVLFLYVLFFVFLIRNPQIAVLNTDWFKWYWKYNSISFIGAAYKRGLTELGDGEQSMILSMELKEESVWE